MTIVLAKPNYKYAELKGSEDSSKYKGCVFAVADGITRDPKEALDFRGKSEEEVLKYYPYPSGARKAADLFTQIFIESININSDVTEQTIAKAFTHANKGIEEYNNNANKDIDYLANDYFACVASAGVIFNKKLFWGYVCDCGVMVVDKELSVKFRTPDDFEEFHKVFAKWAEQNHKEIIWGDPSDRQLWRREFRNSDKHLIDGEVVSFGALTGEKSAEEFVKTGILDLDSGDTVIFYSDGFKESLEDKDFLMTLKDSLSKDELKVLETKDEELAYKDNKRFGMERTLIATVVK